jgi:hypothetical protein
MVTNTPQGEQSLTISDSGYIPPSVTPERVAQYLKNVHLANPINNILVQIFPGAPEVWVEDVDGEVDDELTSWIKETAERVTLYPSMKIAWYEHCSHGCSVKSPGYSRRGGRLEMTELRDLPAVSFHQYPGHGDVTNSLMPGIIYHNGEVEVWQTVGNMLQQQRIDNYAIIMEPTGPKPAGEAYAMPVYPVIAAINHTNKAADQQVYRVGAPSIFLKLESTMTDEMKTYTDSFLKKWGKNTGFVLPKELTPIDPKFRESDSAEKRLTQLVQWVDSYFNPTTVLKQSGGTSIGSSDKGSAQIWANFIGGQQAWIEEAFEEFFKPLLASNGYEDRYVRIQLKRPELDRSAEIREQIETGLRAKAITVEEVRNNLKELELSETTPELQVMLKEQYKSPVAAGLFGNVGELPGEEEAMQKTEARLKEINDRTKAAILKLAGV